MGKRGVGSPPSRAVLPATPASPPSAQVGLTLSTEPQGRPHRLHSRVARALGSSATPAAAPSPALPGPARPPPRGRGEGRRGGGRLAWQPLGLGSASLPGRRGSAPRRRRSQAPSSFRGGLSARHPALRAAPTPPPPRPRAVSTAPAGARASVPGRSPRSPTPPRRRRRRHALGQTKGLQGRPRRREPLGQGRPPVGRRG